VTLSRLDDLLTVFALIWTPSVVNIKSRSNLNISAPDFAYTKLSRSSIILYKR
jgi:hypothetical protein